MSQRSLPSASVRSAVTIALVLHLAAVALGVSVVYRPSPLQQRLLGVFAPYLRPLHLAVDTQPLYLTHGDVDDQPHRFEVRIEGAPREGWQPIRPEGLWQVGPRRARFERWAHVAGMLARAERWVEVADLASAASRHRRAHSGSLPEAIRVAREAPVGEALFFPPPVEVVEEYVADVFTGEGGYPELARRSGPTEMAPPVARAGSERGEPVIPAANSAAERKVP